MASSFPLSSQDRGSPPRRDRYPPLPHGNARRRLTALPPTQGPFGFESAPTPQGGKGTRAGPAAAATTSSHANGNSDQDPLPQPEPAGRGEGQSHPSPHPSAGDLAPQQPTPPPPPHPPPHRTQPPPPLHTAPQQRPPNPAATPCPGTHHGGPAWLRGAVGAEGCTGHTLHDLPAARLASH